MQRSKRNKWLLHGHVNVEGWVEQAYFQMFPLLALYTALRCREGEHYFPFNQLYIFPLSCKTKLHEFHSDSILTETYYDQ